MFRGSPPTGRESSGRTRGRKDDLEQAAGLPLELGRTMEAAFKSSGNVVPFPHRRQRVCLGEWKYFSRKVASAHLS